MTYPFQTRLFFGYDSSNSCLFHLIFCSIAAGSLDSISRRGSLPVWKGPVRHSFAATYYVIWGMSLPLLVSVSSSSNQKEEAKMIPRSAVTLGVSNSVDFLRYFFSLKELYLSSIIFGHSLCFCSYPQTLLVRLVGCLSRLSKTPRVQQIKATF